MLDLPIDAYECFDVADYSETHPSSRTGRTMPDVA